jgi:cyanophycin synthetase
MASLEVIEFRTLDGANIFLNRPAIKVQVLVPRQEQAALHAVSERWAALVGPLGAPGAVDTDTAGVGALLWPTVRLLHAALDLDLPEQCERCRDAAAGGRELTLAYSWNWRTAAEGIAEETVALIDAALAGTAYDLSATLARLGSALANDRAEDDRPLWVTDAERMIPIVGLTGTNGKSTTTRCLAHIVTTAGQRVGMANSNGVWIGTERVLEGDYTGPQGARRVLADTALDVAILETARGGILLRGVAWESNDVGVVTNISADHLGLQGIDTLEGLAEVKSLVVRLTKPDGLVILNADDPLVRAMAAQVRAPVLLFSRDAASESIRDHLRVGGRALVIDNDAIVLVEGAVRQTIAPLAEVPITFGGRAGHMVENALAAAGAALGLGLDHDTIARGLRTFRNSPEQNVGRLNAFAIREPACTFIVDYAHNEAGLRHLLDFGRGFVEGGGRLLAHRDRG